MNVKKISFLSLILLSTTIKLDSQSPSETFNEIRQTRNPNLVLELLASLEKKELSDSSKVLYDYYYGSAVGQLGKLDSSLIFLNLAEDNMDFEDPIMKIRIHLAKGNVYFAKGFFNLSLTEYQKAREINNILEDSGWEIFLRGNIAGVYARLDDYDRALNYAYQADSIAKETNSANPRSHMKIGNYSMKLGNYEKAQLSLNETLEMLMDGSDSIALGVCYSLLGKTHSELGELTLAAVSYSKADEILGNLNYEDVEHFVNKSELQIKKGNLVKADDEIQKALALAKEIGDPTEMLKALQTRKQIFLKQNNLNKALQISDEVFTLSDSIKKKERVNKVYELEAIYQVNQKDLQIKQLENERQIQQLESEQEAQTRIILIILSLVIILSAGIIIYTQKQKNRLKEQALQSELSELRVEIKTLIGKYEGTLDVNLDELNEKLVNPLSEREYDVFKQIFSQKTNSEIAEELFVSINTVKTHLKNLYNKLGVSNRKEALDMVLKV